MPRTTHWPGGVRWSQARWAPVLLAAAGAAVYLAVEPRTGDLAAHTFRADLFGREGFTLWNGSWFGGHQTPAYSVFFPPLAWLVGPMTLGAAAAVVAAAAFESLLRGHFGGAARWGAVWFALGTTSVLFADRLPFMLGVAIGLGSLLAMQRRRPLLAAALAAGSSLASPVAGLFLALAGLAHSLAALLDGAGSPSPRSSPRGGAIVCAAALGPPVLLAAGFAGGGYEPFGDGALYRVLLFVALCLLVLPRGERALRVGAALYGAAGTAAFLVQTPMGTNVARLGALFGGPIVLAAVVARGQTRPSPAVVALLLVPLALWQWDSAVRETSIAAGDPSTNPGYYAPLIGFLERARGEPGRIEIPLTRTHWEVAEVASRFPIARGWERQIDRDRNDVLYRRQLGRDEYEAWLRENGVRFVALPSSGLDPRSYRERDIVLSDPDYLTLEWASEDWRVYEVTPPSPIVVPADEGSIALADLGSDELTLRVREPGTALVRTRWSRYWRLDGGCVEPAGPWTRVIAERRGRLRMSTTFSPERLVGDGRRCD